MLLIRNGLVSDPDSSKLIKADIFIKDGKLAPMGSLPEGLSGVEVLDADGLVVAPGLVDMHVHFRDPGFTHKEDLFSGARAAAAGGVTTAVCMPNTAPVLDTPERIADLLERAHNAEINILTYGAVTVGEKGETLTDAAALKAAGAAALSDDGIPVMNAAVLYAAMKKAKEAGLIIISHCEDANLVCDYALNDGEAAIKLGLPGRPSVAENLMVMRDIMLSADTDAPVHIAHVSTAGAVDIIRKAKAAGASVTAETCPQYFTLTEDEVLRQGSMARVNPPLRTQKDVKAIIEGLKDGTLDVIVTDHAPHSAGEKALPLEKAPSGISGIETSLALALTSLYHTGLMTIQQIITLMSTKPADILGIEKGRLRIGDDGDLVVFDPDEVWIVDPEKFRSKGHNTPFAGKALKGKVKSTIIAGKIVYKGE